MREWFKVRVITPWPLEMKVGNVWFSGEHSPDAADALLCNWAPSPELFTFSRRKAWYCCEPKCQFRGLGGGAWPGIKERLAPEEFLFHNHPDAKYRVPHVTHYENLRIVDEGKRLRRAIAIVSNHGGNPWRRHRHLTYRNRFISHPLVDLYGRSGWKRYRQGRFSFRPGAPANYLGELPGDWPAAGKRSLMARYKVAVCLENMNEPHYFTEKMVEAVSAGCIPVYRADPTVASTFLEGARWFDPRDYADNPELTLEAALEADSGEVAEANRKWLLRAAVRETHHERVFRRIANILATDTDKLAAS